MAGLAVNVDHIAALREIRGVSAPDPVAAAVIAELAGAQGIVVHLREDRRHIQDRDVRLIREVVQTKMIFKMAATPEMVGIAMTTKPDIVTLVPERHETLASNGGVDLMLHQNAIAQTVETLQSSGIQVSILIDPAPEQVKLAHQIDAALVEIHTGAFCSAVSAKKREEAFSRIVDTAKLAYRLKLGITAGYGLCYQTITAFKGFKEIDEFSIGHSIISRAALMGLERAVVEMLTLVKAL